MISTYLINFNYIWNITPLFFLPVRRWFETTTLDVFF